ncbi:GNAT family N-acetyltransferase [Thioclava sp.]|uniref:GNAT family N-acetyltransferase n=1 Tax=Thioclava sp. TaxID=1933450 RepID=UPI003241C0E8
MIRPAREDDLPRIAEIAEAAFSRYIPRIGRPPAPMLADHAAELPHLWVCEGTSGVAGYIGLFADDGPPPRLQIEPVAVEPAAQGQGIGRQLMAFAEARAREIGAEKLWLYANAAMEESRAVYARLGFIERDRRMDGGYDRVFLDKDLTA